MVPNSLAPMVMYVEFPSENDVRTHFYQDVIMNNKYMARLRDQFSAKYASTKKYTDTNDNLRGHSGRICRVVQKERF